MKTAKLVFDPAFTVGPVRRHTFGSFVEHLGRCVYTGIYEPGHPTADANGFRGDVLALVRELGISTVRYPGGNFVSGYKWEDGVGPTDQRPQRLDLAWHSIETNQFGLNEFMAWTKASGTEPMMAVNLGTRGISEAVDLLEYATCDTPTELVELRKAHGVSEPHSIKMWCLGNEMDGNWQIGFMPATQYGQLAAQTGRAMKRINPDLTLVACGSSSSQMETFGKWEYEVLSQCYDEVDLISAHAYYNERGDLPSFLASAVDMDNFIDAVSATADAVGAARKSPKKIGVSFDEWNIWYHEEEDPILAAEGRWDIAPRLEEDRYTVADAVVVGNLLISLLRHTDRVHSASMAQLVNALAPIATEPGGAAWRQTTFHPFALTSQNASGQVLETRVQSPRYKNERYGESDLVDAVTTWDADSATLTIFVVNRSLADSVELEFDLGRFDQTFTTVTATTYANDDPHWRASSEDASSVLPARNESLTSVNGATTVTLPAISWTMIQAR